MKTGTGLPITQNVAGDVVSAQLIDNVLWLLTHGTFGATPIADQYILQTFRVDGDGGSPLFISTGTSSVINFVGDAATRLDTNPPVLSPVYLISANGDISIDPNQMMVWQQNLLFDEVSGFAQKFSVTSGTLESPTPITIGNLPVNGSTLALTTINDVGGNSHYYVHHSTIGTDVINLSHFSELGQTNSPTSTIELANDINIVGIEVENQMSYAKVVKANIGVELAWILPSTTTQNTSTIFSTSIIENGINNSLAGNYSTKISNLAKVEYIDIGSFENNNAILSLRVTQPQSTLTKPALLNLSKLKDETIKQPLLSIINLSGPESCFPLESWLDSSFISQIDDQNVTFVFNHMYNMRQQVRAIDDLENLIYNTITPKTIVTKIGGNNAFEADTAVEILDNIISNSTANAVNARTYNATIPINVVHKVFNDGVYEVVYRYRHGQYNDGEFLKAPDPNLYIKIDENKLSSLPSVGPGFVPFQKATLFQEPSGGLIPLISMINTNLITGLKNMPPSDYAAKINAMTGEGGIIPQNFYELPEFTGIIGFEETDIIQISHAYLSSLRSVVVSTDNFKGTANVELIFNPGLVPEQNTVIILPIDGFFAIDFILIVSIPTIVGIIAIILLIIFLVQSTKKKKTLSKVLSAGFNLHKKMGTAQTPTSAILAVTTPPNKYQQKLQQLEKPNQNLGQPNQRRAYAVPNSGQLNQNLGQPNQRRTNTIPNSGQLIKPQNKPFGQK